MPSWLRRSLMVLAALVLVAVGLQVYSIVPATFGARPLGLPADTRHLVLLIHGSGGRNEPTLVALEGAFRRSGEAAPGTAIVRYVWSPWSDAKLRTYPNGARVGASLGDELAALPALESIHLIAHSAGAYVLEPLCTAYRARMPGRGARIAMTFLDPIGFRGPFDPAWGARNYGRCADDAEAFINTDDPAPATAAVLQHARTTDVTADPGRKNFNGGGHRWPVQYYSNHLPTPGGPG
ncbi:MAG: hypothetical protein ABL989_08550 [Gammaproteobacteria bacterium]